MNDGFIIIVGIIFVFVVWIWTGGPSRPISFSGPFITPLTTVGDTQEGYGEQIDIGTGFGSGGSSDYWSLKSVLGSYEGSAGNGAPAVTNPSPYRGQVMLTSGASGPSYADETREYVSFRNALGSSAVDITGWSIVSTSGAVAYIPQGAEVADSRGDASVGPIRLGSGEEAVVYSGRSPAGGQSFRSNACTNYLDDRRQYDDCVRDRRRDTNFGGDTWFVYLNRSRELWANDHESLKLVDAQGKTVDQYSY